MKHQKLRAIKISLQFLCIVIFYSLIGTGCALVQAPTGGERDQEAPKIVTETPRNYSTNFNEKEITLVFNEYIQLQNPQNVIVSPNLNNPPKINAKKNEVLLQFNQALGSNTTYVIFFGNELKDVNEGNAIENYSYVFSTGNVIDSLGIKGSVQNYEDKLPTNTFITLYKNLSDSAFLKERPNYINKLNADGSFELKNLKKGTYKLYALDDKNSNYFYDLPNEQIGFYHQTIQLDSNISNISIPYFIAEEANLKIRTKNKEILNGRYNLEFNRQLSAKEDQFEVQCQGNTVVAFPEQKTLKLYFNKKIDTNYIQFYIKHNNQLLDSISTSTKNTTTNNYFFDTTTYKKITTATTNVINLVANTHAIGTIDTNKIKLTDSTNQKIDYSLTRKKDLLSYQLTANLLANNLYKFILEDSALVDLANNYNKKQEILIFAEDSKKYGNLLINIELDTIYNNIIFILKDNSNKVLQQENLRNSRTFQLNFNLIEKGTYTVEFIRDDNNNEIWNSGNFSLKTLPEKIYQHPTPITVKENWDTEETIKPNFNQVKKTQTIENNIKNTDLKNNNTINQQPNTLPPKVNKILKGDR